MQTDSITYNLSSGSALVNFQIVNYMDSTFYFSSCGKIHTRIDTLRADDWFNGEATWNSPCVAIYLFYTEIPPDSAIDSSVRITTAGTFRIAAICGTSTNAYPDTILSNSFTVK